MSSRPSATAPQLSNLCECRWCGRLHALPALRPADLACCTRCQAVLRQCRGRPLQTPLALALAGACCFAIAVALPLLGISLAGQARSMTLAAAPVALDQQGTWELAMVCAATILVLPVVRLACLLTVLIGLRLRRPPAMLPVLFAWSLRLAPWAMIEVFLLGGFVAYTRLAALGEVQIGTAAYALAALMLVMVGLDATLDEAAVWHAIAPAPTLPATAQATIACDTCGLVSDAPAGAPCPRCFARLHRRKPDSQRRCLALVLAAAALYLPANIYPVMTVTYLGQATPATILGGVRQLAQAGMWPLAALVFVASVTIPVLKLAGLTLLLITTRRGHVRRLRDRTRLYRLISVIGRWSMIDVFMLAILTALLRLGFIASVQPGVGAIAFAGVVVLTMLASECFDPRLMWDRAGL